MKKENSYGIIPLRFYHSAWQILLVQHHAGHWAFPKGHAQSGETPLQAAERELREETGLTIHSFLATEPLVENYFFTFKGQKIFKTVQYFLAIVTGEVILQEEEIQASRWLSVPDALQLMTFKEGKRLCLSIMNLLKSVDERGNFLLA